MKMPERGVESLYCKPVASVKYIGLLLEEDAQSEPFMSVHSVPVSPVVRPALGKCQFAGQMSSVASLELELDE